MSPCSRVRVSFERLPDDGDEHDLPQEVRYSERDATVELEIAARHHRLDVRKVDPEKLADMREVFRRMNFDGRFRLIGM